MNFASEIWNKPAAAAAAEDDVVTKSLRLDGASDSRLTWTPSSASSSTRQKCVISFWIKKTILGASSKWDYVFTAGGTPWFGIAFGATSSGGAKQHFMCGTLPGVDYMPATYAEYRDPAAWSHYTIVLDTTQTTPSHRMKVWKDGVALTWGYHTNLFPTQYSNLQIGDAVVHSIGFRIDGSSSRTMSGYVADFYLLEHTTLPSGYTNWYDVFAEEDGTTGQWKPKATSGLTFGANGFHLDFEDDTDIGNDVSGLNNDFSATNLAASDIVNDRPTENYAVLNALQNTSYSTLSEGNLKSTWVSGSGFNEPATIGATSGKFYFEVYKPNDSATVNQHVGIARADTVNTATLGYSASTVAYMANESGSDSTGFLVNDYENTSTNTAFGSRWDNGEYIIQCAFDAGTGKVWFGRDNTWQDDTSGNTPDVAAGTYPAVTLTGDEALMPALRAYGAYMVFNGGSDPTFAGNKSGGATSEFYYEPPSGFVALSTGNLPTPTIKKPAAHFNALTYASSGAKTFDNGTTSMQPDLVWVKARGNTYDHELTDSVRGVEKALSSNTVDEEGEDSDGLTEFRDDGFTVGTGANYQTSSMVAWCWKAGIDFDAGGGSDTGSKNPTAGFSIAKWEGDDDGNGGGL